MAKDEMVTLPAKSLATILYAIKSLQEHRGSSPREIVHYISAVHSLPPEVVRQKMQTVLRRGVAHGILREVDGRYSLPIDTEAESLEIAEQELGLLDFCSRVRKRKRQGCKTKKLLRKNKACTHKGGSKWDKTRLMKTENRMLEKSRKNKIRKKSKKIVGISGTFKKLNHTEMRLTSSEKQPNNMKTFRSQSRTPSGSRRSSCVRAVGQKTLSVT